MYKFMTRGGQRKICYTSLEHHAKKECTRGSSFQFVSIFHLGIYLPDFDDTGFWVLAVILWNLDPLVGNDHEISSYTTAVIRQQPVKSSRGTAFSVRPVPRCLKQDT
jgi:hypothetical protein